MAGPHESGELHELKKSVAELRARVEVLEDKLRRFPITEEEWKAYQKVASIIGPQMIWVVPVPPPPPCTHRPCAFAWPTPVCPPWGWGGGPMNFGSGFGGFGT
jgi:hypothetical protein